jgi:polyisoprenoid-binding protein YceI
MRRFLLSAVVSIALGAPSFASASMWQIDSAHTSAQFAVRHLMVSTVRGTLGKATGTVNLDEADPTKSTVEASIDVNGVDTREPKRDQHLKSPDFFDVEKYPTVTFKSKKVTKVSDTKYKVAGDLTMHGVTKEVVLDVEGTPKPLTDPSGNVKLGGVATTKVNRKDFGIVWNSAMDGGGVVVGDEVDVTIDIELVKKP